MGVSDSPMTPRTPEMLILRVGIGRIISVAGDEVSTGSGKRPGLKEANDSIIDSTRSLPLPVLTSHPLSHLFNLSRAQSSRRRAFVASSASTITRIMDSVL